MIERKAVPELAIPGWRFMEVRVPALPGEPAFVRIDAISEAHNGPWFNVAWPLHDDTAFTRKTALDTLMLAVARYIADPGAYYRAQYERMRQDGSAT